MKIEEYRSRWGYEIKAFKVEFWNFKPPEFSIKTVKHSSFYLHSIHQKKLGGSVPDRLQQNLMYHVKYMTRPPSLSKFSCRCCRFQYTFLATFLSRDVRCNYVDTTHVSIVKRGRAECCCDLGERNVLATECCSELGVRNVIVTVGREIFDTRTTISERVVIGWYQLRQLLHREQVSPKTKSRNDGTSL